MSRFLLIGVMKSKDAGPTRPTRFDGARRWLTWNRWMDSEQLCGGRGGVLIGLVGVQTADSGALRCRKTRSWLTHREGECTAGISLECSEMLIQKFRELIQQRAIPLTPSPSPALGRGEPMLAICSRVRGAPAERSETR